MFHVEQMTCMEDKKVFLEVKDHSVSGESFQLLHNEVFDMLETSPQPSTKKLPEYYQSDDYISHTDSKRNLFERVYHLVRNISLSKKVKLINKSASGSKKLLDIGCGTGDFLESAEKSGWSVNGIEPDRGAREIANIKTNNKVQDTSALKNLQESSFDVITLWHVLEHLPDLEDQVRAIEKLLKEDGTLIIAVPNFKSFDAKFYQDYWAAYDVPRHLWHFSQKSISKLFSKIGMYVIETKPMKFDSFYVSLLSEKYKFGKMRFFNAFYRGLQSNLKAKRSGEYSSLIYILKKGQNLK